MKFLACESENLIEGLLIGQSDGDKIFFKPSDTSSWKVVLGLGLREFVAWGCINCNNLKFSVKFNDDDREKYLKFEGQQPSNKSVWHSRLRPAANPGWSQKL